MLTRQHTELGSHPKPVVSTVGVLLSRLNDEAIEASQFSDPVGVTPAGSRFTTPSGQNAENRHQPVRYTLFFSSEDKGNCLRPPFGLNALSPVTYERLAGGEYIQVPQQVPHAWPSPALDLRTRVCNVGHPPAISIWTSVF